MIKMKLVFGVAILAIVTASTVALPAAAQLSQRLIKVSENDAGRWLTQDEVEDLISQRVNFMDITDHQKILKRAPGSAFEIPSDVSHQSVVRSVLTHLDSSRVENFLGQFTSYFNRYYRTQSGVDASDFLYDEVHQRVEQSGYQGQVVITRFSHAWEQSSIIAEIRGSDHASGQVVVIGSHLDSVSSGAEGKAPGADDDGSGTSSTLEAFTALLYAGFVPKTTVQFHWYAAEEAGLLGSQDIVAKYVDDGVDVVAMANFDMTGYLTGNVPSVGFITDFTDAELNAFLRKAVDEYLEIGWIDRTCGYACSDHASWNRQGFKSSFPHEDGSNPYVHTPNDTVEHVQFSSILEYSKLAIGFAVEVAQPSDV